MSAERGRDPITMVAFSIALVGLIGLVLLVPSLLPAPIRDAVGLGPKRIAAAPDVPDAGSYAFLQHQPGNPDAPVGYDPCKRIHVRINYDDAPDGAKQLIEEAWTRVEKATGLRFAYDGPTDDRPAWESESVPVFIGQPRSHPALVSFADAGEVPELAGRVAGVGGSLAVPNLGGELRYVTGAVTLDEDVFAELARSPEGRAEALAIVTHEFGHLVGLGHVHDDAELMNEDNVGLLDFGQGDLAGLARVGSTSCA